MPKVTETEPCKRLVTLRVIETIKYWVDDTTSDAQAEKIARLRYETGAPLEIESQTKEVMCKSIEVK